MCKSHIHLAKSLECFSEQTVTRASCTCNSCDCSLQVHVDKGMNDGQKITFRGEGDQEVRLTVWQMAREVVNLQINYFYIIIHVCYRD